MSLIKKDVVGGVEVAQVDEAGGGIGDINIKELNRKLDAWLAKHEAKDDKPWHKGNWNYGNKSLDRPH